MSNMFIVKATKVVKGEGTLPHRIVLAKVEGHMPFVTWYQNVDSANDFYWGHYFQDLEEAAADFKERAAKIDHLFGLPQVEVEA